MADFPDWGSFVSPEASYGDYFPTEAPSYGGFGQNFVDSLQTNVLDALQGFKSPTSVVSGPYVDSTQQLIESLMRQATGSFSPYDSPYSPSVFSEPSSSAVSYSLSAFGTPESTI